MDPLSVSASIAGILTAAGTVILILSKITDAPQSVQDIHTEVVHIELVFKALQRFLDTTTRIASERAALISFEDVIVILTQTVLVFSELETLIRSFASQSNREGPVSSRLSAWRRITWVFQQPAALRLVNQLQRHKASLTLILQIIQWSVLHITICLVVH
jgi:hypothetical protein